MAAPGIGERTARAGGNKRAAGVGRFTIADKTNYPALDTADFMRAKLNGHPCPLRRTQTVFVHAESRAGARETIAAPRVRYARHPNVSLPGMTTNHIEDFRDAFKIDRALNLSEAAPLTEAVYDAQSEAYAAVWDHDWDTPAVGFRAQTLFNLLSRTYEHAQAMLVASVTGSSASSEVLGRTVIEGAINVTYLAAKGNPGMLLNFLHSWVSEHRKKLTGWRQLVADRASRVALDRIDSRQQLLGQLARYLEGAEAHCALAAERSRSPWPTQLLQRFQALGREEDYFECYHRLSGACHLTGEDTISYLMSQDMPHDTQVRLGIEAHAYSRMMTMFSCLFFLDAAEACAQAFGGIIPSRDAHRTRILQDIVNIGPAAGVPNA